jgi:hypothetical protein
MVPCPADCLDRFPRAFQAAMRYGADGQSTRRWPVSRHKSYPRFNCDYPAKLPARLQKNLSSAC